ncbi:MAG TPA: ABC transporter ATP-binding protein [Candidatus Eisenbacteria bacterium]|nr:ABC transporter ATP-binding protein [Candidatus Eisenbacteria bacterium]
MSGTLPVVGKILRRLRPHRWLFASAVLQVLVIGFLELAKPWPLKIVVDNVLGGKPLGIAAFDSLGRMTMLAVACVALIAVYALLGTLSVTSNYATISVGQRMVNDFRAELYAHLQRLSLAFHSRREVGDLLFRLTADTFAIQTLTMNGFFPILTSVVLLGGMLVVMLRLDWMMTLVALAIVPLLFVTIVTLSARINALATDARMKESALWAVAQRTIGAIRVIQAFTTEPSEHRRFVDTSSASLDANLRLYTFQSVYSAFVGILIAAGTAGVLWFGASHVMQGTLSIGDVLVFTSYLASLYAPINSLTQTWGLIQGARVGAERVFEILETAPDLLDGQRELRRADVQGRVRFEDVHFAYEASRPVLRGVTFEVVPGSLVAVVGATGAGKTTLVGLIPRFYDVTSGRVRLDGVDVREFKLRSLRQQVGMVLQPPLVFPTSLRDNIAYGRPEASVEEVRQAAELAQLGEFIARLPQGIDTVIGEGGATLSSGEQLRVTIARALLRDAPLLILDEPTSALDVETEARVMAGLENLMTGRTTFVIAHRLSTVRRADVVLVLDQGQIAEQGSFAELVQRGGHFARLYRTQFAGEVDRVASS